MTHDYLFNQITEELTNGGITGWCEIEKAHDLAATVIALRPKVVLETGTWGGRSLIPLALACQHINCGQVICIDPWSASASTQEYDKVNADWWGAQNHEAIYEGFIAHLHRLGLTKRVEVQRMKSDDALVPSEIDLLHLDSNHTELATREVNKFAPRVRIGGIVVMDDMEWKVAGKETVAAACRVLLGFGFIELYRTKTEKGCWGVFQRVSRTPIPVFPLLSFDPSVKKPRQKGTRRK